VTLNPARLARFSDWAQTLTPRPLPRTAVPVPGEYYIGYISRLAAANHLELPELTGALDDPAAVILLPAQRKRHQQERLAAAAGQPLPRIARLYRDDHGDYLRDPGRFREMLRPACRRCTARLGITGPVACRLPARQALCRRHRLWTGPAARTHAGQLDVSPFPEILRAQRRHLALLNHYQQHEVEATVSIASTAVCQALASVAACNSSSPAPGSRPWPACSAAALPCRTTAPAAPPSRSRSIPTSSGWPHAASGSTTPATAKRPDDRRFRAGQRHRPVWRPGAGHGRVDRLLATARPGPVSASRGGR
jgi:hypothetical protein